MRLHKYITPTELSNNSLKRLFNKHNRSSQLTLSLASLGLLLLLVGTFTLPFNQGLFSYLFTKPASHAATLLLPVNITGVYDNNSSVKITFSAVPGAKDYRVYDIANPSVVKYAGLQQLIAGPGCPSQCNNHFVLDGNGNPIYPYQTATGTTGGPTILDVPTPSIEWNLAEDRQPHTLVVQAVDSLGPVPPGNLYDPNTNAPLFTPAPSMMPIGGMMGMPPTLGINEGQTPDGMYSINGQGPYTNNPQTIAQSQPFVVQANVNYKAIPSQANATNTFFDTFDDSEGQTLTQTALCDSCQTMSYSLNKGTPLSSTIQYQLADTKDSKPFIDGGHFMNLLFDGGTPGTNNPLHQGHGVMALSPDQLATLGTGQILHLTMEADLHVDGRRWISFVIVPANAPLTAFDVNAPFSSTNQAVFFQLFPNGCTLNILTGSTNGQPSGTAGGQAGSELWGAAGQAGLWTGCGDYYYTPQFSTTGLFSQTPFSDDGIAFDNRSRVDLFISQTHAAFFIDDNLVAQSDIPAGSFPWFNQPLKVYFEHYVYHTDNDINELLQYSCAPTNSFWFNNPITGTTASQNPCNLAYPPGYGFSRSDERHWDNFGFEVLPSEDVPSNSDWSSLASLVSTPSLQAPQFITSPSPQPSTTSTPPSTIPGDFNGDGHVNLQDLSIFAASYGTITPNIPNPQCDLNSDGHVNLTDLSIFSSNYGK